MTTSSSQLDERYGRKRNRGVDRAIVYVTLGIVVVGVIIWVIFGGWGGNAVAVKGDEVGFTINEGTVTLRYKVSGPPGTEIVCALGSMSQSKAVVGWKVVVHEPTADASRVYTEDIVTVRQPNSGYVHHCWVAEPDQS